MMDKDINGEKKKMNGNLKNEQKNYLIIGISLLFLFLVLIYLGPLEGLQKFGLINVRKQQEQRTSAEQQPQPPEFVSNELLIKVKREARGRVHDGNPNDTGITTLDSFNSKKDEKVKYDFKIKSFERVAKQGKDSKTDSDLFSWYKVTFDAPATLIEGKLNHAKEVVENNPANSDNKSHLNNGQALSTLQQLISKFKSDPNIEDIDLNYIVHTTAIPNDPYYSSTGSWGQTYDDLWGLKKINAASAWDQATGSASIIVAGIDTGVDRNHEDLAGQMWVNTNEIAGNKKDDDHNGYVDDYYGWDYVNNDNDPMDDHGHGTHTVGTIAAVGNNGIGVVGVNWTSKIMALKFLGSNGSGYLSDGIKALQYAADMGAKVSSNSWGCGCPDKAMDDAIKYEHDKGMVTVTAAGNSNADAIDFSPADADYAITVAASDSTDAKAWFSNWGEKIDVAAPGVDILSTRASVNPMCTATRTVGTNYCRVSGTSMATPHVAGLAALLLSKNPSLTNEEVRQIIRNSADDLGTLGKDKDYGYGRINAFNTLNLSDTHPLTPVITSPSSRTVVGGNLQILGYVGGPIFASYKLEAGVGRTPTSWTQLYTSTVQPTSDTLLTTVDTTKLGEGPYIIRLTATDTSGKSYQFQVEDITIDNFDVSISFPNGSVSLGTVDIIGTATTKNGLGFGNYKLEWSQDNINWSSSGISLVNNGNQPVIDGKLAAWDTSTLTDGQQYTLRLTITATTGASYSATGQVKADKDLVKGWPKPVSLNTSSCTGCGATVEPAMVDLDNDGIQELVVLEPDGKLFAYHKDGSQLQGFPVSLGTSETFYTTVNADDLDNDGKKEIVVASSGAGNGAKLYVVKSNGAIASGWPHQNNSCSCIWPSLGDINGDGKKEIIAIQMTGWSYTIPNYSFSIDAFSFNGTELSGFPKSYTEPFEPYSIDGSFPSIIDLDKDGKPEISWAIDFQTYLFDNQGNILSGWPFTAPLYNGKRMVFQGSASGDIDGDGKLELFASSRGEHCGGCETELFGWKKDGTVLQGWPKTDQSDGISLWDTASRMNTPSIADIDGDGKDDVVVGLKNLAIFGDSGKKTLNNPINAITQPALSDLDGDGKIEYIDSWYSVLNIAKNDGSSYWNRSFTTITYNNAPAVIADMDHDGKMEMSIVYSPYGSSTASVYLWEIPTTVGPAQYEWPMFSHDPARTGRLVLGQQPPTPTPNPTLNPTPTPSDTIPPTVSITSPLNGATVTRRSTVTISATASDNVAVSRVEFYVNGALKCTDTTVPFYCAWFVPASPNKTYQLQTKAYDPANNTGLSPIVTVTSK